MATRFPTYFGAHVTQAYHDIAQTVRDMTEEEREVFDLLLLGHDPSDQSDQEIFTARVQTPLSRILPQMIEKGLVQRIESAEKTRLMVNPAVAWFLIPLEERQMPPA